MRKFIYVFVVIIYITMINIATAIVPESKTPKVPDFSRYQTILNRMPFGAPPPDPGSLVSPQDAKTAAQEAKEQQQLARKLNMSCVNITPSGTTAVGFTDLSQKPAVNFYLLVGASAGGWTLKSADYTEEWAELEKDGTTIFVKLGQGLMNEPPKSRIVSKEKLAQPNQKPGITTPESEEIEPKKKDTLNLTAEERFVHMTSLELLNGVPSPNIELTKLSEKQLEEQRADKAAIRRLKKSGVDTTSYRERLAEKRAREKSFREEQEKAKRAELEEIAVKIAQEEIDRRLQEAAEEITDE